ncbi:hypothetical protein [Methylosinus sp. H3A]|uniref:hypothetical protein n=1 Tax=Methylosinus sp. H3A TaxID=2785786 RepID=UPI001FEF56AB|nr:hypothetical protein [Methylosinus sp. H3A]
MLENDDLPAPLERYSRCRSTIQNQIAIDIKIVGRCIMAWVDPDSCGSVNEVARNDGGAFRINAEGDADSRNISWIIDRLMDDVSHTVARDGDALCGALDRRFQNWRPQFHCRRVDNVPRDDSAVQVDSRGWRFDEYRHLPRAIAVIALNNEISAAIASDRRILAPADGVCRYCDSDRPEDENAIPILTRATSALNAIDIILGYNAAIASDGRCPNQYAVIGTILDVFPLIREVASTAQMP